MTAPAKFNIESAILDYDYFVQKAQRELRRLNVAELAEKEMVAMDAALNAAFTIFHLFERKQRMTEPNQKKSAWEICADFGSEDLKLLHDIVNCTKHVYISKPFNQRNIEVTTSVSTTLIIIPLGSPSGVSGRIEVKEPKIIIKFDKKRASEVLQSAFSCLL